MELKKITAKTAIEICADIELEDEAKSVLSESATPSEYLSQLLEMGLKNDAAKFLARALPRREATWWACLSARQSIDENTDENLEKVLEMTEGWVYEPTDERRHAVNDAAQLIPTDSPIYWAAMASFWSGGSMAPPDLAEVLPADNLCSMAVSGAVLLAAISEDEKKTAEHFELFFKQGFAIANGDNARQVTL